jgi:GT2 family glycosyltransferase
MNAAVRASIGDVIVLTNPEVEHREPVLDEMLALLETENDYVVAPCIDADGTVLAGRGVDYSAAGRLPVPQGAHFHFAALLRRDLFERVGGFDPSFRQGRGCEDNDWLWSLHAAGARFRLSETPVYHYRTPHVYEVSGESNRDRLQRKWGHLWTRSASSA